MVKINNGAINKLLVGIIVVLIAIGATRIITLSSTSGQIEAIESRQETDHDDITVMKSDIKYLVKQVDKLIEMVENGK